MTDPVPEQVIRHDITPSYEIEVEWTDSVKDTGLHYRVKVLHRIKDPDDVNAFKDEFSAALDYLSGRVLEKKDAAEGKEEIK